MNGPPKKLILVTALLGMMVTGCPTFHEERTRIYRHVAWRSEIERIEPPEAGSRAADRWFFTVAVDQDTQVTDFAFDLDYGTNGYEVVPMGTNGNPSYQNQIEAAALARGDYDPNSQHLFFYQTVDLVDLSSWSWARVTIDAEDSSPDKHGIDPGDRFTVSLTNQDDLDDGSGVAEEYNSTIDQLVPFSGFDSDDDGDVDLDDYAKFQQDFSGAAP